MIALAKRRGIPVVFAIHNFAYVKACIPLAQVDYCIVPSPVRACSSAQEGFAC